MTVEDLLDLARDVFNHGARAGSSDLADAIRKLLSTAATGEHAAVVDDDGWVHVPRSGCVRPALARAIAVSILNAADEADARSRR